VLIVRGINLYAHDLEYAVNEEVAIKAGRAVAFGVFNEATGSQDLTIVAEREPGGAIASDMDVVRSIKSKIFAGTGVTVSDVRLVSPGWLIKTTSGKISREANAKKYVKEFVNP